MYFLNILCRKNVEGKVKALLRAGIIYTASCCFLPIMFTKKHFERALCTARITGVICMLPCCSPPYLHEHVEGNEFMFTLFKKGMLGLWAA